MLKNDFLNRSLNDFLDDPEFICRVNNQVFSNEDLNNELQDENMARIIIESSFEKKHTLQACEIQQIWLNLEGYFNSVLQRKNSRISFFRYAAIVLFIVATSISSYFVFSKTDPLLAQLEVDIHEYSNENAMLVLTNGKSFQLMEQSTIKCSPLNDELLVNDQKIQLIPDAPTNTNKMHPKMNSLFVPYGHRSKIQLPDGSQVWLNSGSKLLYPSEFSEKNRIVYLTGEGFFKVSKNTACPFIVKTRGMNIEVLGTSFNVTAWSELNTVETVLVEGKVKLTGQKPNLFSNNNMILEPGQKGSFDGSDKLRLLSGVDIELYTSWIDGRLKFDAEPLSDVLNKICRYYGLHADINQTLAKQHNITGKLDLNNSVHDVLNIIADLAPVECSINNGYLRINEKSIYK